MRHAEKQQSDSHMKDLKYTRVNKPLRMQQQSSSLLEMQNSRSGALSLRPRTLAKRRRAERMRFSK